MVRNLPVIDGFSNLKNLDAGGAGTVYSATDDRHNRQVAIKILTGQVLDQDMRDSFARELQAMGALSDHPYITTVYQSGFTENSDDPYLVMPLYEGSYKEKLEIQGPLTVEEFHDTAIKILSALATAHDRDILHRDIKPANIFVGEYGTQPKLGDFGISTLVGSGKTTTTSIAYTLTYAPPELLDGQRQTKLSDIYTLGATFYTLLAGKPPYAAANTTALIAKILTTAPNPLPIHVPATTASLIMEMLDQDPTKRPQTCHEVADALQAQQKHPTPLLTTETADHASTHFEAPFTETASDLDDTAPTRVSQPKTQTPNQNHPPETDKKSRWLAIGAAAVALVVLAGGAIFYGFIKPSPTNEQQRNPANGADSTLSTSAGDDAQVTGTLSGHTNSVSSVRWSPDGKTIATASWDNTAKLWDPTTGENTQTFEGHTDRVVMVAWSPDGKTVATASWDNTVKLWDPTTGENTQSLEGHEDSLEAVAWSPDGETIATSSWDDDVKLWNPTTGENTQTLAGNVDGVVVLAWAPDSKRLAVTSDERNVKLWDTTTSEGPRVLETYTTFVGSVGWSPDGDTLVTGGRDGSEDTIKLWNPTTGENTQTLVGHTNLVLSIAWSPDGTTIATASDDQTVKLWDPTTGSSIQTIETNVEGAVWLDWSPDGKTLASSGSDDTAKLWSVS